MACFAGRNVGHADPAVALEDWVVSEPQSIFSRIDRHADGPRTIGVHCVSSFAQNRSGGETTFSFASGWCSRPNRAGGIEPTALGPGSAKDGEADSPSGDALYPSGQMKCCRRQ